MADSVERRVLRTVFMVDRPMDTECRTVTVCSVQWLGCPGEEWD